jgi:cystathionine beta-synthase
VPANVHIKYVDEVINVTDRESFDLSRQMGRLEGLFCGGSTGTNVAAALRVAREADENAVIVFIVCDTGEHYLTKHHSDEWMKEKQLLEPQKITAGLISGTKESHAPKSLVWVSPSDKLADALAKMNELGLTQLPVFEEGRPVGSVREGRALSKVVKNRELLEAPVSEVMEASFPTVDVDASSNEVTRRLQSSPAVLVEEYGRIVGIITRHDVLDLKLKN